MDTSDAEEQPRSSDAQPWTRVGAYAVCRDGDRLLVCRIAAGYPEANKWTLPGGGVDFGEHPDEAVLRELREETGLAGHLRGPVAVVSLVIARPTSRPGPLHAVAILYDVEVDPGPLRVEEVGSTAECAWMHPQAALALPHVDLVDRAVAWLDAVDASPGRSSAAGQGGSTAVPHSLVLGRATTAGEAAPLGARDPVVAARAVRRALAAANRRATDVATLLLATTRPVPDQVARAFARRALGPHATDVRVVTVADSSVTDAEALATHATRELAYRADELPVVTSSAGRCALAVGIDHTGTTVALCLGRGSSAS